MRRFAGWRAFWVLWVGMLLSFMGSGLTRFGLSVWIYQETRDALAFAGLLFFAIVPLALGSLVAGPLVDAWDRRRVLIVANVAASLPTVALMILFATDALTVSHLWVAMSINGVASAFVLPALDASTRMLVPVEGLSRASGFLQSIQTAGLVVAPPLAGVLMVSQGLGSLFVIDLVTVALGVTALLLIDVPRPLRTLLSAGTGVWRDFLLGFRYVTSRAPLLVLVATVAVATFAGAMVYAASGPLVLGFSDERGMGLTYAAFGSGSLLAALAVGATGGPADRMRGILLAALAMGVGAIATGWSPNLVGVGLGVAVIGAGQSVLLALQRTILQLNVHPEVLGRVFALRLVVGAGAQAAGILLTGWLAARLLEPALLPEGALAATVGAAIGTGEGRGVAFLLVASGAALVALVVAGWALPAIRSLERRLGAPPSHG